MSRVLRLILPIVGMISLMRVSAQATGQMTGVVITVDRNQVIGTSAYSTGMTHIDHSLRDGDPTAMANVKTLLTNSLVFQNTNIMGAGVVDPWPDPAAAGDPQPPASSEFPPVNVDGLESPWPDPNTLEPTNWGYLDHRLSLMRETGATPMITLVHAPWWMKGQLQANGTTKLIPDARGEWGSYTYSASFTDYRGITYPAGYVSPDPYNSRVLDNMMDKWVQLVRRVAERYMVAPYNVRYFIVWNEMKGYYNPSLNQWDYQNVAGNSSSYNAKHGYTYMYNRVYQVLREAATAKGINPDAIKIGGPYVVVNTWTSPDAGGFPSTEPALQNKPYGTYDQRDLDVIKGWLQGKTGAGYIAVDGKSRNRELTTLTDSYTANDTFADIIKWIRSLDNTVYRGAQTLPIFYTEWYANPHQSTDRAYNNAVKADGVIKVIKAGGGLTLPWGGVENTTKWQINSSMYTNTDTASGGQPLPWYYSYKAFRDYFPPGTSLLATTQSSGDVSVLASASKTMIVNRRGSSLAVTVNGVALTLAPYEVRVINTPSQTSTQPAPTATRTPTRTPTRAPDTTRPTVTITSPANNATVTRGATVTIRANASDNVGVARVVFSITGSGGNASCTDTTSAYTCNWLVPKKPNVTYTITATAYDAAGNSAAAQIQVRSTK